MDALALLCNLYADGPTTLQRLRVGGCESLAALLEIDASSLEERLDWNHRTAERFLREAWILAERLDVGWLEEDRTSSEPGDARTEPAPARTELPAGEHHTAASTAQGEDASDLELHRAPLLERWRELDRDAPPTLSEEVPGGPLPASVEPAVDLAEVGLEPAALERLREAGLGSLEAFAGADALAVGRLVGQAYTRVVRLQQLARRRLGPPATGSAFQPRSSASEGERLEAAGPFA